MLRCHHCTRASLLLAPPGGTAGALAQGSCAVGDTVELPALKLSRQVKSLQSFRRPVASIVAGDRAALCVTQLNPELMERGLAAAPGSVPTFAAAVAEVDKVGLLLVWRCVSAALRPCMQP